MPDTPSDPNHPTYGLGIDPRNIPDSQHIQLHCHRGTLMEAISACMSFIDTHNLETPDITTDYEKIVNPNNGQELSWYEATVSAKLPEGSTISIVVKEQS